MQRTFWALAVVSSIGVTLGCGSGGGGVSDNGGAGAPGGASANGGQSAGGAGANAGGSTNGAGATAGGMSGGGIGVGGVGVGGVSVGGVGGANVGGVGGSGGVTAAAMTPFPGTAPFYQDISQAKLDDNSDQIIKALDAIGWGDVDKRTELGVDFSFNINLADGAVARRAFTKTKGYYSPDCDFAPVPLPVGGKGEGVNDYACNAGSEDCHLLVYQGSRYYELYKSNITGGAAVGGTFTSMCLVIWDLKKDYWAPAAAPNFSRGDGCTGADAADLPMAPLIVTKQDLAAAEIKHALRFTIDNNRILAQYYVHPATHLGGPTGGADMLPYGARLRLRGDYPMNTLPSDGARKLAKALQTYGMYLADGGNIYISATTDAANTIDNSCLGALKPSDFQMVDGGARIDSNQQDCARTPIVE